jgi:hypothetical protein
MMGLIGVIALLTILGLSLVATGVATVARTLTGSSDDSAGFQARSAFTGTGITRSRLSIHRVLAGPDAQPGAGERAGTFKLQISAVIEQYEPDLRLAS